MFKKLTAILLISAMVLSGLFAAGAKEEAAPSGPGSIKIATWTSNQSQLDLLGSFVKEFAEKEGIEPLLRELRAVDPEAAERIHPSNQKRVIRALEVYLETGKTITQHNRETRSRPPKYRPVWIGLDYVNRSALYARIDARVDEMFAQGLVDEVRRLLEGGVPERATSMQAIGYKELTAFLRGEGTEDAAREQIKLASRRYAKRQRTWFRRNPDVHWIDLPDTPDFAAVLEEATALCR